jgi:signal transduction histidine kinase
VIEQVLERALAQAVRRVTDAREEADSILRGRLARPGAASARALTVSRTRRYTGPAVAPTDLDPATLRPTGAANLADDSLEEINRLWTIVRAFSNAAHDVNNDLQVIGGSAELLERRDLEPAVRRRVEAIREQAVAAAATINRLLAYSRAEPGTPGPVDLSQVVSAAVAMRRASLSRARITIAVAPAPEPCRAVADGGRMLQALLDVLLAAEAIARHRPNASILLRVEPDGDAIAVHVTTEAGGGAAQESAGEASPATPLTIGAQLWAAARLARSQGGGLSLATAGEAQTLTLRVPAYRPRT